MGTLQQGAEQAIRVCLGVKPKEKVVIVTDKKTLEIGKAFEEEAKKITDNVKTFILEDFGKRPLQKLPDKIADSVKKADVSLCAVDKVSDEVYTIRRPLRLLALQHCRYANMPGITKQIMEEGMCIDYKKIWIFSKKIYDIVKNAKEIKVTTEKGTHLIANFDKKYRWVNSNGDYRKRPQTGTNLPGAEIFTFPSDINGVVVIDGILGDCFTQKYGSLEKNPITLEIGRGKVTNISCKNKNLEKEFSNYVFKTDENSSKIGEFALGTNIFLKELIGVMLQDEKSPSLHIAVGDPHPNLTNASYTSKAHCDAIIRDTTVSVDGKKIMEKGRYLIL